VPEDSSNLHLPEDPDNSTDTDVSKINTTQTQSQIKPVWHQRKAATQARLTIQKQLNDNISTISHRSFENIDWFMSIVAIFAITKVAGLHYISTNIIIVNIVCFQYKISLNNNTNTSGNKKSCFVFMTSGYMSLKCNKLDVILYSQLPKWIKRGGFYQRACHANCKLSANWQVCVHISW